MAALSGGAHIPRELHRGVFEVSKGDRDDQTPDDGQSPGSRQYREAMAIRYRGHATELRELASTIRPGARRRRILEIAAKFEQHAIELESRSS